MFKCNFFDFKKTNDYFNPYLMFNKINLAYSIKEKLNGEIPVIVCIGSDLILGDSLAPLCGTLLKSKNLPTFIYGTLSNPITAKEVKTVKDKISKLHFNSKVLTIDASIGESEDVGYVKLNNFGLRPGLGLKKNLGVIGDISILGIVAKNEKKNYDLFNNTHLNTIYNMAKFISDSIEEYFNIK